MQRQMVCCTTDGPGGGRGPEGPVIRGPGFGVRGGRGAGGQGPGGALHVAQAPLHRHVTHWDTSTQTGGDFILTK